MKKPQPKFKSMQLVMDTTTWLAICAAADKAGAKRRPFAIELIKKGLKS